MVKAKVDGGAWGNDEMFHVKHRRPGKGHVEGAERRGQNEVALIEMGGAVV